MISGVDLSAISINRDLSETIYSQLCRQLRQMILNGSLTTGTRMPSTRILSAEISVSRITVRESYDQLVAEGYLMSEMGKGTYVSENTRLLKSVTIRRSDELKLPPLSSRATDFLAIPLSTSAPSHLPFNPALPDVNLFPFFKWNRIVKKTLYSNTGVLDYSSASGFLPLREILAHSLSLSRGIRCDPDQLIIVASSEQAIKRTVFLLLNQSDCVWYGEPGMYSRRNAFRTAGANVLTVPVDNEGVIVKKAYRFGRKAKLAYVFPWLHYPMGITMSLSRRLELLKWASSNNAWILEDDFGCEFSYVGKVPPPIQSLDIEQRVLYMGGFSLTLFPAIRLSYIIVPKPLVKAAKKIARSELSVATVLQPALAEYISAGHHTAYIRKMRKVYHRRQKFLASYLEHQLGNNISLSGISGGLNFMLNLPSQVADKPLSNTLARHNIIAHPLSDYYLDKQTKNAKRNALVLGFACSSRQQMEQSAKILVAEINTALECR